MARTHREIFQHVSRRLAEEARFAGIVANPGAMGEARELAIREVIRPLLGVTFDVAKGELIDADGGTTPEYDAVIYDASTAGPLCRVADRSVLRVESAAVLIEVKSKLEKKHADQALGNFAQMWALKRYYRPGSLLDVLFRSGRLPKADKIKMMEEGIAGNHTHVDIPPIATALFAFDGPSLETASEYFGLPGVDLVCVLGKYTFARANEVFKENYDFGRGDDALGAFCSAIEEHLFTFGQARSLVSPYLTQYYRRGILEGRSLRPEVERPVAGKEPGDGDG